MFPVLAVTPTNAIVPMLAEYPYPRLKSEWREPVNLDDLRFESQPAWET